MLGILIDQPLSFVPLHLGGSTVPPSSQTTICLHRRQRSSPPTASSWRGHLCPCHLCSSGPPHSPCRRHPCERSSGLPHRSLQTGCAPTPWDSTMRMTAPSPSTSSRIPHIPTWTQSSSRGRSTPAGPAREPLPPRSGPPRVRTSPT